MSRRVGAHVVEVEGDLLKLTVHGTFDLDDMKQFTALADAHATPLGYLLILNDVTAAKSLSAEARRYSAARTREAEQRGPVLTASASFGAGMLVRGVVALFYSMLRLTSGGGHRNRMTASEAEARAFLGEQRQLFLSQQKR